MTTSTIRTRDEDARAEAHTWDELAEYERGEVLLRLLRRISCTCLRNDRLRVLEREEWVCSGAAADGAVVRTHHLLLFGHVRHRHRDALLALIRQTRLHAVRDLDTSVTIGLLPGDAVPSIMLQPLAPSLHTDGCILWNRVYFAMRSGILQKLCAREEKMRQRLRELIQETNATSLVGPSLNTADYAAASPEAGADDIAKRAETLRFYTEEFGHLFTAGGTPTAGETPTRAACGDDEKPRRQFLPLSAYMAATKETRVSLTRVTAIVPTILVAWSIRYPDCVGWLGRQLFDDTHLRELRKKTGLSGRFAVLMETDPWVAFAEAHGGLLPRLPNQKKGFKIDLLQPLPKRAQIVLLNMDEDNVAAQAAIERLRANLDGWESPEVDLLSLWSGPEGLQSELATLFNVQTLPFVVQTQPGVLPAATASSARLAPVPVIAGTSSDPTKVSKALYDVPDTPRASDVEGDSTWHGLSPAERARVAKVCGGCVTQQRLPVFFTASVTRDHVLCNPAETDPWRAIRGTETSRVCFHGDAVATDDVAPFLPELRLLAKLKGFEWNVRLILRSTPLVSAPDPATPQRLLRGETRCVTCSHCSTLLHVDRDVHVRCVHCSTAESNDGVLCERCAFTLRCHPAHHFLLRIPAGQWCPSLPLLWGPSNVAPLELFMGRFVSNASDYHYGVYCDRCRSMIRGTRWKCALCHHYDLCDACARARRAAIPPPASSEPHTARTVVDGAEGATAVSSRHDDATHPMLWVPFAQGSHINKFIQPECLPSLQAWLETV